MDVCIIVFLPIAFHSGSVNYVFKFKLKTSFAACFLSLWDRLSPNMTYTHNGTQGINRQVIYTEVMVTCLPPYTSNGVNTTALCKSALTWEPSTQLNQFCLSGTKFSFPYSINISMLHLYNNISHTVKVITHLVFYQNEEKNLSNDDPSSSYEKFEIIREKQSQILTSSAKTRFI